jgi:hypothetical protein
MKKRSANHTPTDLLALRRRPMYAYGGHYQYMFAIIRLIVGNVVCDLPSRRRTHMGRVPLG